MSQEKDVRNFLLGISENSKIYFVGSTTKNALEYTVGEEMVFKIRVKADGEFLEIPYVYYTLEGDDGEKSCGYEKCADDGWFYINTSLKKEGFVHLIAKACDDEKNVIDGIDIFEGGAGADIERLTCGTDVPENYFDFWNSLKEKTFETAPEVIYKKEIERADHPDYVFYDMRIKTASDMYVSFIAVYPKNAEKGSLKLCMIYRGYGVNAYSEYGPLEGTLAVWVNAHSIPNFETDKFYEKLRENELKDYGFDNTENQKPETTYWSKMFMRDLQAFRFFKDNPLINKKDYIFRGGSQGAMQACNMALHSGVATECELDVPWFADLGGTKKFGRLYGWRPDYADGLRYFDTAVAAKYLKCPVTIIAGLGDYVCPPSGEMAMYNGITAPKKIEFIQNQTHPYRPVEKTTYTLG